MADRDGLTRLRLDVRGARPLSTQLVLAIRRRIEGGRLAPGDRLPPVRVLAGRLDLAPNTVAKAYGELEASGLLVGQGRRGTFVARSTARAATGGIDAAAAAFAREARALGVDEASALAAVERALRDPPDPDPS